MNRLASGLNLTRFFSFLRFDKFVLTEVLKLKKELHEKSSLELAIPENGLKSSNSYHTMMKKEII